MPRNKKSLGNGKETHVNGRGDFKGFVRHTLTSDEKKQFEAWSIADDDVWAELHRLVDSGYKFAVGRDDYNDTYQATLTCNNAKSGDFGWCLVARAPDTYTAICLILFKHNVLLGGDWVAFNERHAEDRTWG